MNNKVTIIYCGHQLDYLYGIISGFNEYNVHVDVIDSKRKDIDLSKSANSNVRIKPFLDQTHNNSIGALIRSWLVYYRRLTWHIMTSKCKVYHIEWINRKIDLFEHFYFPIIRWVFGKKIVFKVHDLDSNILLAKSGGYDAKLKWSKRFFLRNVDSFIVHNDFVGNVLTGYGIAPERIYKIPHGINNYHKPKGLTKKEARLRLGIPEDARVLLFYGNIRKYKGIEYLLTAFEKLSLHYSNLYIIVAGKLGEDEDGYYREVKFKIDRLKAEGKLLADLSFIPASQTEQYFKASDVLVLPYRFIYQSGLPFLAFAMGVPIICNRVGGLAEDIEVGKTGFIYDGNEFLETVLRSYLNDEFHFLEPDELIRYSSQKFSWDTIISQTIECYSKTLNLH